MIPMVDLRSQYDKIRTELNDSVQRVMDSCTFIGGPEVEAFSREAADWLNVKHVIPVGNGTDALQIALMTAELQPGDEVIVPSFTYAAPAEAIALLGLTPVMTDVDAASFNLTAQHIEEAITPRTKAIIPVHLFGQSCRMDELFQVARKHRLLVFEDNAQSFGARYNSGDTSPFTGTESPLGCVSFFPTKNLACMGDGGALTTNDDEWAARAALIARHGQRIKYHHERIGCNSRLDALQAAILRVNLRHLNAYLSARQSAAAYYDKALQDIPWLQTPFRENGVTHTYNQYTLQVHENYRDELATWLHSQGIPTMIYYPVPLHRQKAFAIYPQPRSFPESERLCKEVLSLPMHTELNEKTQLFIIDKIHEFAQKK